MRKLDRQDWESVKHQAEQSLKQAESAYLINEKILEFSKKEAEKCPMPTTKKEEGKNIKSVTQ